MNRGVDLRRVFLETSGAATGVSALLLFAGAEARALSRALAFANTLFQRRSFMMLPIDALVGLFQLPPILSVYCATTGAHMTSNIEIKNKL